MVVEHEKGGAVRKEPAPGGSQPRPWHKSWPPHLPHSLDYPDVPAWWILERNLDRFGDRDAIVFLDFKDMSEIARLSYAGLYRGACALSVSLTELGVRKGDRVATVLPNSPAFVQSYYGVWLAGATMVPNNVMATASELSKAIHDAGATVFIASEETLPRVMQGCAGLDIKIIVASVAKSQMGEVPRGVIRFESLLDNRRSPSHTAIDQGGDVAVIIYTGGTTGEPKGAMLTHRNIVVSTIQYAEWYAVEPGKEVFVCVIPMSHSGGMAGAMNVPLYGGATLVVLQRANPPVVGRVVEEYRATRLMGVPTLYAALLNDKDASKCDYSSLRACRSGAAPLPVQIKEAFDRLAGKEVLVEAYGLTETSPLCIANPIHHPKAGSVGIPMTDTDARIVDIKTGEELPPGQEGELLIRGPQVMKGYLNKPEATAEALKDGWLHTGDVARMDDNGYFYIVDRLKDFINASGFKVWPREVEEVLYKYPGVKLAAVVGVPDAYRGENVKAFIVPRDEAKGMLKAEDIESYCRKNLSAYKVPHIIEFRDELPLSPAGKILRRLLRQEEAKRRIA